MATDRITDAEAPLSRRLCWRSPTLTLDGSAHRGAGKGDSAGARQSRLGDVIKIYAVAKRPDAAGARTLSYENRYEPARASEPPTSFCSPAVAALRRYGAAAQRRRAEFSVRYTVSRRETAGLRRSAC